MDDSGARARDAVRWRGIIIVVAVGLLLRLLVVWETRGVPTSRHPIGDAAGYLAWAQRIAGGDWWGSEGFYQAPLYPYVLGVCVAVLGSEITAIRVIQALWGAAGCGCLAFGASLLLGRRIGLTGGWMLALYGPAIYYDTIIQKATLSGLLTCVLLATTAWSGDRRRPRSAAVVGFVAALLSITRENALVWVLLLAVWVWWDWRWKIVDCRLPIGEPIRKTGSWVAILWFAVGTGIVLAPVAFRNRVVGGEWSISTFQAGPNFYIGNHRGADGRYQPLVRGHETPSFERTDATLLAQQGEGRALTAREVSRYWMRRAMNDITADLPGWFSLLARKAALVIHRYEIADAESFYLYRESSLILAVLGRVWHFGVLIPAAAVGVLSSWSQRRRLWLYYAMIVSMALAVALFYVLGRYRYPLVAALILFAAAGAVAAWDAVRQGAWRRLMLWLTVAAVTAVAANVPIQDESKLNALARMNAGVALAQEGRLQDAIGYFRRALADHPASPEGHNNLAQGLALTGNFAEAIDHYEAALRAAPDLPGVHFNLAVALEQVGRVHDAQRHYETALAQNPADADAQAALLRLRP